MRKKSYNEKLLDPRWQKLRLQVFERDEWKCVACSDDKDTLHAHHVVYSKDAEGPWDYRLEQVITLCQHCHEYEHEIIKDTQTEVLLALAVSGYRISHEYHTLLDCLTLVTKEDIEKLFVEKLHGEN